MTTQKQQNQAKHRSIPSHLDREFPAIAGALEQMVGTKTLLRFSVGPESSITISVKQANEDLLYTTPRLFSGSGCSLTDANRPEQLGRSHQVFLAIDCQESILGHIGQIGDLCPLAMDEKRRDKRQVKYLISTHKAEVKYLLSVTVTEWCHRLNDGGQKESPLGELVSREIAVTVYLPPGGKAASQQEASKSFTSLLENTCTDENLRLHYNAFISTPAGVVKNPDALEVLMRLNTPINQFDKLTFANGFADSLPQEARSAAGFNGTLGDVAYHASLWESENFRGGPPVRKIDVRFRRGRVLVGFHYSSDLCLQLQRIDATVKEAQDLLAEVNSAWAEHLEFKKLGALWQAAIIEVPSSDGQ